MARLAVGALMGDVVRIRLSKTLFDSAPETSFSLQNFPSFIVHGSHPLVKSVPDFPMDALTVENEVLDTGEESFLLVYLCLLGSFLYFLWLRKDETNVSSVHKLEDCMYM